MDMRIRRTSSKQHVLATLFRSVRCSPQVLDGPRKTGVHLHGREWQNCVPLGRMSAFIHSHFLDCFEVCAG